MSVPFDTSSLPGIGSRVRVLDARRYHASFLHSLRSELRKITVLRSFWILSIAMIAIYSTIIWAISSGQRNYGGQGLLDASFITAGITFVIIFPIVQGAVATTNEYSSNTMRTTTLSDPRRVRSYFAKLSAVGIVSGIANLIMIVLSALIAQWIVGGSWRLAHGNGRTLLMFWVVLTTASVMTAALGYILRHAAGTITAMFAGLYVSPAILLIPNEWVRETLANYLPYNAMQAATRTGLGNMILSTGISWSTGIVTWLAYVVLIGACGLFRYMRSDI